MICRFCDTPLHDVFLDLGTAPPSNAFLSEQDLARGETWLPLTLYLCRACLLVQVDEVESHQRLFTPDYVYFSSFSRSWLEHARRYVEQAVTRLELGPRSLVVEIASNDGYLLQYVVARGIPCLGIEPTAGTAAAARSRGIETIERFFGLEYARELAATRGRADLVIANNVLAHVPELRDFVAGIATLLAPGGSVTLEFPHLYELVHQRQFDTVYHEHFSYFSFTTATRVLASQGLEAWDVERLPTHGGSLRVWAAHAGVRVPTGAVARLLRLEADAGMGAPSYYEGFQEQAEHVKNELLEFLLRCKRDGVRVAAYGAAAKGNTLLNFAGVRRDLLPYAADASPHKQGRYLPGSRIPVVSEAALRDDRPDVVLILPWNLREEIVAQLAYVRAWGGRFACAVPRLELF